MGTKYHIKVDLKGSGIIIYKNGTQVLSATDNTFSKGMVGFGSNNAQGVFDNAEVFFTSSTVGRISERIQPNNHRYSNLPNVMEDEVIFNIANLALAGKKKLSIYTCNGILLNEILFRDHQQRIKWDGTDTKGISMAVGIYFYTLEIFKEKIAGKIIKVK
jgi:hypothetical protein